MTDSKIDRGLAGQDISRRALIVSLTAILATFAAVIFVMTALRYMSFLALNWDLGINMQMLWTTNHGYLLYETADFQTSGIKSFLQINSAYIALPVAYIYRFLPSAYTLLSIQAIVLSLSAIPIYLYSFSRTRSQTVSLLISIVFLSSFAVMSGVFFDFHWEAFLPLEFFSFVYFTHKRRYVLSGLTLLLGALTLEVFPFMAASYLLFAFFFPQDASGNPNNESVQPKSIRIAALVLLFLSAILYYIIAYIGSAIIPGIVGAQSLTPHPSSHSIEYLFNFGLTSDTIINSLLYWLLLLVALGFVPLLKLRPLIVLLPWFYWSVIAFPNYYTSQFGVQYGIIACALLLIPFIEGVAALERERKDANSYHFLPALFGPIALIVVAAVYETTSIFSNHSYTLELLFIFVVLGTVTVYLYKTGLIDRRWLARISVMHSDKRNIRNYLLLVIFVGLLIGPLNPVNTSPPITGGYAVSFSPSPSFHYMKNISSIVGHNGTVLSTDNLFPFVANDPNAYSFFWFKADYSNYPYFPFNESNLPQFLLLSSSEMFTVPSWLSNIAFNTTQYGLILKINASNYPGNIYFMEMDYKGQSQVIS